MDFRENLTRIRLERHMTQMNLAEAVGVSLDTVVQWENGDAEPPIKDLVAISDALQVSVNQLLGKGTPLEKEDFAEKPETVYCPCCGREVKGSMCLSCEFPMNGYEDKGPRYALVLTNNAGESHRDLAARDLSKYCGITEADAAPFLSRYTTRLARRGITDVAAHWIAGRLNPEYFSVKIVEDAGEPDAELLDKPKVMEKPAYIYADNSIGVGGIILIVVLTIIALSIF